MVTAAATRLSISWSSSSLFQSWFSGAKVNESSKCTRVALPIVSQKKAKKIRKIILTDDVAELGKKGQVVDGRAGFYRNLLAPSGKAQMLTSNLLKDVDKKVISLPEIRETGEYVAELKLHPQVTAQVRVNVFAN